MVNHGSMSINHLLKSVKLLNQVLIRLSKNMEAYKACTRPLLQVHLCTRMVHHGTSNIEQEQLKLRNQWITGTTPTFFQNASIKRSDKFMAFIATTQDVVWYQPLSVRHTNSRRTGLAMAVSHENSTYCNLHIQETVYHWIPVAVVKQDTGLIQ